jgi:Dolichyl-phosphate-mannose-protein mannosyltransferase
MLALAAVVLAAFLLLSGLALAVPVPRVLSDELTYTLAAASLADGDGLQRRGEEYGFGPVYPAVLAAILSLVPDRETAYPLFKIANALLFTLAAVPIYFLARRLLPPWWSLGVAALSIAIPSSIYVSLVMTESAAYPAACLAILAIVLALERPSVPRQLAVLAAIALAVLTRTQFVALFVAYVAALVFLWIVVPAARPRGRRGLHELWPTFGAVAVGVAAFVALPLATGSSPSGSLGAYDELWGRYDPVDVGRWLIYHLAAFELYLAVVPLAVTPIVLSRLVRSARGGSRPEAAFASTFVAVSVCLLIVAAAFSSTDWGSDKLHDRYLFYAVPLWLVVFAVWLHDGLPRPVLATACGAGLALVLPALVPFSKVSAEEGGVEVDAVVTHLWAWINATAFENFPDHFPGRRVLAVIVVALVAAAVLVPRRFRWLLAAGVAAIVLLASGLAWRDSVVVTGDFEALLPDGRTWVDDAVGTSGPVTSFYVSAPCAGGRWSGTALLLTEFFNRSVDHAAHVVERDGSLLPSSDVRVASDGAVVRESGPPLEAGFVLAPRGIAFRGRRLARGTTFPLVLWQIDGPVRLVPARSSGELQRIVCRPGP